MKAPGSTGTLSINDANLNKGFLLGNAVGRDGRAIEGRSGYWFSARTRVEAGYRQNKLSSVFYTGGGTITDGFVNAVLCVGIATGQPRYLPSTNALSFLCSWLEANTMRVVGFKLPGPQICDLRTSRRPI